MAFVAGLLCIK